MNKPWQPYVLHILDMIEKCTQSFLLKVGKQVKQINLSL